MKLVTASPPSLSGGTKVIVAELGVVVDAMREVGGLGTVAGVIADDAVERLDV